MEIIDNLKEKSPELLIINPYYKTMVFSRES